MGQQIESNANAMNNVDIDLLYHQGKSLANLGHYADALAAFEQAIAAHSSRTQAGNAHMLTALWVFRAVVLLHLQAYDDALTSCDHALALEPRNVEALVFRGVALNYLERYQDSYASYAKAMGLASPKRAADGPSLANFLSSIKRLVF